MGSGVGKGDWELREHEATKSGRFIQVSPGSQGRKWSRKKGDSFQVSCLT